MTHTSNASRLYLPAALFILLTVACTTTRQSADPSPSVEDMDFVDLPELIVRPEPDSAETTPPQPPYKPAEERTWDLLHTRLALRFDFGRQEVHGQAELTLAPVFYTQQALHLDAVGMEFHSVAFVDDEADLTYVYDGQQLHITLPEPRRREEAIKIMLAYTARPTATDDGASAAILSDQGLFFIDPLDTVPELALQVWTQGETSHNRRWFPTIDQPNERHTQEIYLTVPDTLMTLSNGIMLSSTPRPGSMREDYWRLDLPHAPYLTMIAIGQWDRVTDYWRGRPVDYYVDPGYGESAREIFAHTPEMLDFFSRILGYDYVWPKYAQVVVQDFVSGAMENTTASVFGSFVQFHADDLIETGTNDYIVAHELFHHWFGNLVTCESWANLVLNEGFANYAEYLWYEHKYGRERADLFRLNELSGYYDQAAYDPHPLVHFHYDQEGDMFDAHSYNKGGLVLHMLRELVGDEAFFASLRHYLETHAYGAAEIHDLRQAFEQITGRDLNWFFNQWYFGSGHPVLSFSQAYDPNADMLEVTVRQSQADKGYTPLFHLPLDIGVIGPDTVLTTHSFFVDQEEQVLRIPLASRPLAVIPDPRDVLLAETRDAPDSLELTVRVLHAPSINHRISAMRKLGGQVDSLVLEQLMADSSQTLRRLVASQLAATEDIGRLGRMADAEWDPLMQFYLMSLLMPIDVERVQPLADRILSGKALPALTAIALTAKAEVDPEAAWRHAQKFADETASPLVAARIAVLMKSGRADESIFLAPEVAQISEDYLAEVIGAYAAYLSGRPDAEQDRGLAVIVSDHFRRTKNNLYRRFLTISGLVMQYNREDEGPYNDKLVEAIRTLYAQESNTYLRELLKDGLGDMVD